jgi:hypothetical protein
LLSAAEKVYVFVYLKKKCLNVSLKNISLWKTILLKLQ